MGTSRVERARSGDHEALTALLKEHDAAVRRAVEADLPPRRRADISVDDVLQITYTEAFVAIGQNQSTDESSFAAWLKQIALNTVRDALRMLDADKRGGGARRVTPAARAENTRTFFEGLLGGDSHTPSRSAMQAEDEARLHRAIEGLPERHQRAVHLYDLEGRSIDEVAVAIGCSPGAVHLLRVRAHKRLRQLLTGRRDESQFSA